MNEIPDKLELKYEGKAKKVYRTADAEKYIVEYKDDATAFNAQKRGSIQNKGVVNNAVTEKLFTLLMAEGVPTHFLKRLSEREQLVRAVTIIPIEVIVRNVAAGSFATRYEVEEGAPLNPTVIEWCYKSDELGDPPLNDDTAIALSLATAAELSELRHLAERINDILIGFFAERNLRLIDVKLEFGKTSDDKMVLADEISPDTCRLWDMSTGERLDKDRFRRDLGQVEEAYEEVLRRVLGEEHA